MTQVHLTRLGLALPAAVFSQATLWDHRPWPDLPLLERLFLDSPVQTRCLALPPTYWGVPRTLDEANRAWKEAALALGEAALRDALGQRLRPDFLGVTTVTGAATPGLDLLLAQRLDLPRSLSRVHFNNIGCHAALPLLRTGADWVRLRPDRSAALLAVEICSACFQADTDPQNLVALSLFGDAAAALTLEARGPGPRVVDFESGFAFEHLGDLGFDLGETGFRILLSAAVPDAVRRTVGPVVDALLARNGLARDEIQAWCLHPGGARVLDEAGRALGLSEAQLRPARRVLRTQGNCSSPTVLFVLAEALALNPTLRGPVVLAAFGPGLGVEAALLDFGHPDDGAALLGPA
jgi:predicted naringenin-chalcone synthase